MSNNKTLKVFSSTAVAGMIAAAMMSSQAFAAVDAYSVKVGNEVYKYDRVELEKSFLDAKSGEKAALYEDFTKKLGEAKGFYAFNDTKNGYVDYKSIEAKFLEAKDAGKKFDVNAFTESKDAKVLEVKTAKKAVVNKDGKVEYVTDSKEDEKGELQIKEVKALNLKQVKIEFNKAVKDQDKIDDIEDEDNYTWESSERDEIKDIVDKVEIDKSGKFAILTFADKSEFFNKNDKYERPTKIKDGIVNQETYRLIIDENIIGKEVKKEVKFNDTTMPEVENIEVVGNDTIKVKFTEPIRPDLCKNGKDLLDDESFIINDDNIGINEAELVNENKEVNLKLGTTLKDGEKLKVEVRGTVEDYAGFGVKLTKKDIKVKEDTARPEIISAKKVKKGEVTLVFNRDIKFKGTDAKMINPEFFDEKGNIKDGNYDISDNKKLDEYYHTNNKDKAYAVKIDGRELTMYFDEKNDGIPNGTATFYVKSGELETLWEKENVKLAFEVHRDSDNTKPLVKSVEQDKDDASLIKVKFNKELDVEEAENKDNFTIKDEDGKKISIKGKPQYKNSDKEVHIFVTKKLESGEYKITIDGVEDKYGNVMDKVTKKLNATEKDARTSKDLKVNVYNASDNDQKIVIDFDTKMKTGDGKYSVTDLSKYTLVAYTDSTKTTLANVFKGGKSSVNLEDLYNAKIKSTSDNKKVEIVLPYKESKDDSYNFKYDETAKTYTVKKDGKACGYIELQIGKVADSDDNVNNTVLKKGLNDSLSTIDVDTDQGEKLVKAISPDEISVTFKDKMNIKNDDISLIAVPKSIVKNFDLTKVDEHHGYQTLFEGLSDADKAKVKKIDISKWYSDENNDGNTVLSIKPNKNNDESLAYKYDDNDNDHVLNYDGTIGSNNDILFVEIKEGDSKNDYDAKLTSSIYKVIDNIAPVIKDNNNYKKEYREVDNSVNDEVVQYYVPKMEEDAKHENHYKNDEGVIVLTFEENIDRNSINNKTFALDEDDDYNQLRVTGVDVKDNKVAIKISGLKRLKDGVKVEEGFDIIQKSTIRDKSTTNRGNGNELEGLKTEIGGFKMLKASEAKNLFDDLAGIDDAVKKEKVAESKEAQKQIIEKIKGNENAKVKVEGDKVTITVKPTDTIEALLKDTFKNVKLEDIKQALLPEDKQKLKAAGIVNNDAIKNMKAEDIAKKLSDLKLQSGYEFVLSIDKPVAPVAR